jgi:hypothetical protein
MSLEIRLAALTQNLSRTALVLVMAAIVTGGFASVRLVARSFLGPELDRVVDAAVSVLVGLSLLAISIALGVF